MREGRGGGNGVLWDTKHSLRLPFYLGEGLQYSEEIVIQKWKNKWKKAKAW